jgi:hypothetical protein
MDMHGYLQPPGLYRHVAGHRQPSALNIGDSSQVLCKSSARPVQGSYLVLQKFSRSFYKLCLP